MTLGRRPIRAAPVVAARCARHVRVQQGDPASRQIQVSACLSVTSRRRSRGGWTCCPRVTARSLREWSRRARRGVRTSGLGAALLWLASAVAGTSPAGNNALGWFEPWVELEAADVRNLQAGRIIAKTAPARGNEIAVFIAGTIDVDPDVFTEAVRDPERLWTSQQVPHVRRFSTPPRLEDLDALHLNAGDVEAIRRCRPGDCDVKLTATEMRRLQRADSIAHEFRRVVLERVIEYLERGFRSTDDFHDHDEPVDPLTVASGLLLRSPLLREGAPLIAAYFEDFPNRTPPDGHSFVYWLETQHTPKPTIQVVHVVIDRRVRRAVATRPDVLVASRQVYASHYLNGSLSLSALVGDRGGSRRYLAYATRAHVDGMHGWLSGLRRLLVERRVRRRGAAAFEEQRRRIESWPGTR